MGSKYDVFLSHKEIVSPRWSCSPRASRKKLACDLTRLGDCNSAQSRTKMTNLWLCNPFGNTARSVIRCSTPDFPTMVSALQVAATKHRDSTSPFPTIFPGLPPLRIPGDSANSATQCFTMATPTKVIALEAEAIALRDSFSCFPMIFQGQEPPRIRGDIVKSATRCSTTASLTKGFAPWEPVRIKIPGGIVKSAKRCFMTAIQIKVGVLLVVDIRA
jgi:hypothetical protein